MYFSIVKITEPVPVRNKTVHVLLIAHAMKTSRAITIHIMSFI